MSLDIRHGTIAVGRRTLLKNIDAQIPAGEFVALLGPNGVGKTTLLRSFAGVHPLIDGVVTIDKRAITSIPLTERARTIALVASDDTFIEDLRVYEVVATGRYPFHQWWQWNATQKDEEVIYDALGAVGMESYVDRLFATLSSGERQRVWIALALAQQAPILLLDEPTSHLDIRAVHEILALLRNQTRMGKTILCAIHDINDALAYADRLMLLADGHIAAYDVPERILASDVLERVYGISMERMHMPSGASRVFVRF